MHFTATAAQAESLREVLADRNDGEPVTFTAQGDGTLVVAFSLATATIETDGTVEND